MAEESNELPTSRIARWAATGALILLAIALYFREGRRTAPLTAPAAPAAPATPAAPPAPATP